MYTLGIDIGSSSSKTVILKDGKRILAHVVVPLGTGTVGPEKAFAEIFKQSGIAQDQIAYTVATGYGRLICPDANAQISELSCHAKGIHLLLPQVDTIIDIGGQDAKALTISSQGKLTAFQMNDKCAAGTGRFFESMARAFEMSLDDFSKLSLSAKNVIPITAQCAVFAESEVISLVGEGKPMDEIAAGIELSVAKRCFVMAKKAGVVDSVTLTGGCAKNEGLKQAIEKVLKVKVVELPVDPQLMGALGAAEYARQKGRVKQ